MKIAGGDLRIAMPQVRGAGGPFHSGLLSPYLNRMREMEKAIPFLYLHGLSTRRVQKALASSWESEAWVRGPWCVWPRGWWRHLLLGASAISPGSMWSISSWTGSAWDRKRDSREGDPSWWPMPSWPMVAGRSWPWGAENPPGPGWTSRRI